MYKLKLLLNSINNWLIVRKYPFLSGFEDYKFCGLPIHTKLDFPLPKGWRNYVLTEICPLIKKTLKDYGFTSSDFKLNTLKEKLGALDFEYEINEEIDHIVAENFKESMYTILRVGMTKTSSICCKCGAKATITTDDYILPYCDKCHEKLKEKK